MGKLIKGIILIVSVMLLFGSFTEARAGCRLSEITNDSGKTTIVMENSFLKLIFEPAHGGRCSSFVLKGAKDLVWFNAPRGGIFEDHFWQQTGAGDYTNRAYKYEIFSDTPEKASLKLFSTGESSIFKDIEVEKTISIYKGKSYIDADYRIKNVLPADKPSVLRFGFWMHNDLRAGGSGRAEKNIYYAPTINGIREIEYNPEALKGQFWEYEPTRGWSGAVGESKEGAVCLFDYKYLKTLYWCQSSANYSTLEWRYNLVEVKPSDSFTTRIRLIPFKGLSSIEGAGDILVGSLKTDKERYEKNDPISVNLTLNSAEDKDIILETGYRVLPSDDFWELESKKVSLSVNTPKKMSFNFKPEREGTYVIRCLAIENNEILAEFFKPVIAGKDTGSFKLAAREKRIEIKEGLEDLVPLEWRPITKPIETPHIKWAKPYAKERPRVLFLTAEEFVSELTQLSRRMDIEIDFVPLAFSPGHCSIGVINKERFKFVEEKLKNNKYDVILSSNLRFEEFPEEIKKNIINKVAEGAGFICIAPSPESPILSEILPFSIQKANQRWPWPEGQSGAWKKEKEHFITTGIPFSALPGSIHYRYKKFQGDILASSNKDPILSINEYKKGRIAALSYFAGSPWITPSVNHYAVEFNYWEYYYSLLAKSILWAAKKETDLKILSLKPDGEKIRRGESVNVEIILASDINQKVTINANLKDKGSSLEKVFTRKADLKKDKENKIIFNLPQNLPSGLHLIDISIRNKQDRILNWGTAYFTVISGIEIAQIKTDREYYKSPEAKKNIGITLKIENKEGKSKEVSLNIEFSDCFKRLLISKTRKESLVPGINEIKFTLFPENLLSPIHYFKVTIKDNTGLVSSKISPVYTPKEPDEGFSDYMVMLWGLRFQPPYLSTYFYQLAKGIGVRGEVQSRNFRLGDENNFWTHLENLAYMWCRNPIKLPDSGYIRKNCFSNPTQFNANKNRVRQRAKNIRKHNVLFYALAEECSLNPQGNAKIDVCFCEHCQDRFREWLKKEYKTLEALNAQWGTDYDLWDKAVPIPWEKADKTNPSQWIDFRVFMEDEVWIGGIKELSDEIRKVDTVAYVGINASVCPKGIDYPFDGWNYAKLYKYDRAGVLYKHGPKLKLELLRSLKQHKTSLVHGYSYSESDVKRDTWYYTLHGACGASYFMFANSARFDGLTRQWTIHPNLCYCQRSMIVKEAVEDLVKGVGKILINTPRYKEDEIGILYFRPSMYRSWIEDEAADGPSYISYRSSNHAFRSLIESLQLQYNFIIEEQALRGELNKYKVIFLPYMVSASPEILEKIDEFVKRGGVVIANMRLASCDVHGKPADYSSFLKRVFGIKREQPAKYSFNLDFISGVKEYKGISLPKKMRVVGKETIDSTSSGIVARHKDNTPAITVNKYGRGYGIYLNFVPKSGRLIEKMLFLGGIKREIKLTTEKTIKGKTKQVELSYETFRWKKGDIEYVGILRPSGGLDKNLKIRVSFPYQAHIYDVRGKKYLGFDKETFSYFDSPDYKIFALLPYEVEGINLILKPDYKQGELLKYGVKIKAKGKIGDHTLRIEVYDADGNLSEAYTKNVIAEASRYEDIIPLALNEEQGTWRIKVIDVISGKTGEKTFTVKGQS